LIPLLAEVAHADGATSMRAVGDQPRHPFF